MSYQLYRNTTIGNTLQESLDELINSGLISQNLGFRGMKILKLIFQKIQNPGKMLNFYF